MRRGIDGSSATFAFPAGSAVTATSFGAGRGTLFDMPGAGRIAVTYAPLFPAILDIAAFGRRGIYSINYNRWCAITVDGVSTALHLTSFVSELGSAHGRVREQLFDDDLAVLVSNPGGRRFRIRILGNDNRTFVSSGSLRLAALLSIVASLRW